MEMKRMVAQESTAQKDKEIIISIVKEMTESMTGAQSTRHWAEDAYGSTSHHSPQGAFRDSRPSSTGCSTCFSSWLSSLAATRKSSMPLTVVELAPPAVETPLLRGEFAEEMKEQKGVDVKVLA